MEILTEKQFKKEVRNFIGGLKSTIISSYDIADEVTLYLSHPADIEGIFETFYDDGGLLNWFEPSEEEVKDIISIYSDVELINLRVTLQAENPDDEIDDLFVASTIFFEQSEKEINLMKPLIMDKFKDYKVHPWYISDVMDCHHKSFQCYLDAETCTLFVDRIGGGRYIREIKKNKELIRLQLTAVEILEYSNNGYFINLVKHF